MVDRNDGAEPGRLTRRERALLDRTDLPPEIRTFLERLIQGTALRDQERLDVLQELIAHFEDGLRAGHTVHDLIGAFGDGRIASHLLSRARRQTRVSNRRWMVSLDGLRRDVRVAFRGLRRNPSYSIIAILTLALGIGANTAVFSVVHGVLLTPLPYPEPNRLVTLFQTGPRGDMRLPWSAPNIRELDEGHGAFTSVVGYGWRDLTLTGRGEPRLLNAVSVSGSMMRVFGVYPALGRDITREETLPGGPAEVVVSHTFWEESLGGDPHAVGRILRLSGIPYRIVGVAPEGFDYPRAAEVWVPGQWSEREFPRDRMTLRVVARLAPGVTVQRAGSELSTVAHRLASEYPESNAGIGAAVVSLDEYLVGGVRVGLMVLLGAVAMVLLIACVNVANLVLVRGANRSAEIALRSSLGASRGTLLRQLMVESVMLSLSGAVLGVLLAVGGVHGLRLLAAGRIPRMPEVTVDGPVLVFAAAAAVAAALLFGLVPALRLSAGSLADVIRGTSNRATGSGRRRRGRSGLIAAEVGLSLVLLIGAGLLLRSFARIRSAQLGFDPAGVREFTVTLPGTRYAGERSVAFFNALHERLASLPGVEAVGMVSGSPLGSSYTSMGFSIVGEPAPAPGEEPEWIVRWCGPDYLAALRIPLLRGRHFAAADRKGSPDVALVSQAAAKRFFNGKNPIGQRFYFDEKGPIWTVVGVVGDVRSVEVTTAPEPEVYLPYAQWGRRSMTVMIRTGGKVAGLNAAVRREVAALDPDLAIYDVQTLDHVVASSMASQRFYLVLLGLFAGLAVVLAAVGLYGVIAYLVSGRTREIGIRIALGAHPRRVAATVAAEGAPPVLAGVLMGVGSALVGARALTSLLYQIEPWDPPTFIGGTVVLVLVATLASLLPARKASRTSPTAAMRSE